MIIGASMSEPHTSESAERFLIVHEGLVQNGRGFSMTSPANGSTAPSNPTYETVQSAKKEQVL